MCRHRVEARHNRAGCGSKALVSRWFSPHRPGADGSTSPGDTDLFDGMAYWSRTRLSPCWPIWAGDRARPRHLHPSAAARRGPFLAADRVPDPGDALPPACALRPTPAQPPASSPPGFSRLSASGRRGCWPARHPRSVPSARLRQQARNTRWIRSARHSSSAKRARSEDHERSSGPRPFRRASRPTPRSATSPNSGIRFVDHQVGAVVENRRFSARARRRAGQVPSVPRPRPPKCPRR